MPPLPLVLASVLSFSLVFEREHQPHVHQRSISALAPTCREIEPARCTLDAPIVGGRVGGS